LTLFLSISSIAVPHLDVKFHSGGDPYKVHNYYTGIYNKIVFELLERKLGKHEAVLFARSATAGGQQYSVHWGGDCESTYEAMSESLRGGLSLTMSGFGFWTSDSKYQDPPREGKTTLTDPISLSSAKSGVSRELLPLPSFLDGSPWVSSRHM